MIIDDPAPTLHSNGIRYAPTSSIQDFIEDCLEKDPQTRISVTEALNHSFLKRASSHQLLQKYLSRKPELNKTNYLMSRPPLPQTNSSFEFDNEDEEEEGDDEFEENSWDELDFINSTWNFNEETIRPPHLHTAYLDRNNSSDPVTPNDEQQQDDLIFNTRVIDYRNKEKEEHEFLMTRDYYY